MIVHFSLTMIYYNKELRAKQTWFNPTTMEILDGKQEGAICFSSKAEYRLYLILDKFIKEQSGELFYEKPLLYTYAGKRQRWNIDYTVVLNNKKYFIEYKSAFTMARNHKFTRDMRQIYVSMPNLFERIFIVSKDDISVRIIDGIYKNSIQPSDLVYNLKKKLQRLHNDS